MTTNTTTTAIRIAGMIKRNVDLRYADVITYERFGQRSVRLWDLASVHAVVEEVTRLTTPKMGSLGKRIADSGNFDFVN